MLEARCRAPGTPQGDVKRAQIVLLAAEGRSTRSIAKEVGVQPRIVSEWRPRFLFHKSVAKVEGWAMAILD
jgi:transposase-like protein